MATIAEILEDDKREQVKIAALEAQDAELARKMAQKELDRTKKLKSKGLSDFQQKLSSEDVQRMIDTNPEVKKKAIEIYANESLTNEQGDAQLIDFIHMKNKQALDDAINSSKGKKKKSSNKVQVLFPMKKYVSI